MGSKTDTYENAVLDHLVGTASTAMPTAVFSALFTVIPSDSASGTEVTAAYTRVTTPFVAAGATVDGQIVNTAAVTYSTAATAYTVVGWGLFATVTGGTIIYWATVTTLAVGVGDQATFAAGNITVTED
jgi:hypothetical protein